MFLLPYLVRKEQKKSVSLLTKSFAVLSLQAQTSVIMDGFKTSVVFGVILMVSGKLKPKSVCILLFLAKPLLKSSSDISKLSFQLSLGCRHP